ncbi:hypothetical protein [Streptomyces albus]|uniref:hypothetical protein n=1 Tax=Streptomyces albus TaxID=1888 RepID=UPI00055C0F7F|nr:hypothetical protein [Streptomyces albus]
MWQGLDEVDWAALEHHYGSAEDVPVLLRRCAGPDREDVHSAAAELLNHLFHQGGWICPAATAALPFLVRLAASPNALLPGRRAALELVSSLASEAGRVAERFLDPGWQPAWERTLPDVLPLLTDPAADIRRDTADVLGVCDSPGELVLPVLLRCLRTETDQPARLDLVLALGRAARREPSGPWATEAREVLRGLLDAPQAQTRLAAVHALAPGDRDLPLRRMGLLLEAVRDPSVEVWRHTSAVGTDVRGVHHWTAALFTGPSPAFALGLLRDHPDADQRIGALSQAAGLLAEWRSPAAALLPALRARLDDPAPEVRFRAVELLACLGPAAAAHADEAAALLGDTAARATRKGETVAEGALWALARMNDPRCVPGLIEAMAGARPGFAWGSSGYPVTAGRHYAVLPGLHEVLGPLTDHAEALVPAIVAQLETATDDHVLGGLCQVLADWGPAAEAAVPQLLGLLEDDRTWAPAARALAGIGVASERAQELLLTRSRAGGAFAGVGAWAHWKVGGEAGPAVAALGGAAAGAGIRRPDLSLLADLGPRAARCADRLRTLTADSHPRTRVEAAHALWAVTGDTDTTVPVLTAVLRDLAEGSYHPVMLPAVRHLARTRRADRSAVRLLGDALSRDQRFRSSGGWRGFTQDETMRSAMEDLLAGHDGCAAAAV